MRVLFDGEDEALSGFDVHGGITFNCQLRHLGIICEAGDRGSGIGGPPWRPAFRPGGQRLGGPGAVQLCGGQRLGGPGSVQLCGARERGFDVRAEVALSDVLVELRLAHDRGGLFPGAAEDQGPT
jgi:hypothetical protein